MKLQAKDCAHGGIFQMEPQRSDNGTTPRHAHPRAVIDPRPDAVLLRQPQLPGPHRSVPGVGRQHCQRPLAPVRRPRQRPGRHPGAAAGLQHRHTTQPQRGTVVACRSGTWPVAGGWASSPERTRPRSRTRPRPASRTARPRTRYREVWPPSAFPSRCQPEPRARPPDRALTGLGPSPFPQVRARVLFGRRVRCRNRPRRLALRPHAPPASVVVHRPAGVAWRPRARSGGLEGEPGRAPVTHPRSTA